MPTNWDDLKLFLAVARTQSLSGGGKALRLDPATLSRRIARLETVLGRALFVKSPQGYVLTDAGEQLLPHAEAAEAAVQRVELAGAGSAGPEGLTGQIRIGAPDGVANFLLPQVCAAIGRENPNLDIQIVALPRVFNLSRREADMAISVSAPSTGRQTVQKITDYKLHLAAAPTYLHNAPPLLTRADLGRHRVVGYIPDMIFDKQLDYQSTLEQDRVALASNSVSVQTNWIRQGAGIGIAHDFALPVIGGIKRVLINEISLTRSFYLVRHSDDRKIARLNRFADRLLSGLRDEVNRLEALA
ncbi:LysR family transcriptional regulator [Aliishimia ponticola]|uniref:LysR family transcriptional regulator n=1 Tax=Aliishimia ponticola TaxID=2499833 RepID=A0A4S4NQ81_9RHOB|nr:LysR family transcriptional regulator [Aliishimia ponticola]THH38350.1 LysR family transcriptional regulator [Aliishimia ponticola]